METAAKLKLPLSGVHGEVSKLRIEVDDHEKRLTKLETWFWRIACVVIGAIARDGATGLLSQLNSVFKH